MEPLFNLFKCRKAIFLLVLIVCSVYVEAQVQTAEDTLIIDLDKDQHMDTVVFIREELVIMAKFSSAKFRQVKSKSFENIDPSMGRLKPTASGFIFSNNWMRAGYECQFRYEPQTRRIRLIGMSRYEFGNAAGDGSGKSSVNLLTNSYIADWNYFDYDKEQLVKIPTIKGRLELPKMYLDGEVEQTYDKYASYCSGQYDTAKKTMQKSSRK